MTKKVVKGEYAQKGEYHKHLDKNWKFYSIYVEKMVFIKKYISRIPKNKKIIDLGCGEGVLVEEFKKKGYDIVGLDYNYSSKNVIRGDITKMRFKSDSFDLVMALDVIEHFNFEEQDLAVKEIKRIVKKNGIILISVPNLAHFASRISFLFLGKLLRTSTIDRHKGDRPINEYLDLLKEKGLKVLMRKGLFPTYPISSFLTFFFPSKVVFLHKFLNKFLAYPNWCLLNIIELKK
ncbi:MAG: class I SAM-dependent methyltransferase [Nanoarchaeota archaeon]|nr:class I SAM-dependent methyltransferase [DPANN group archaeon]MBL7116644.1 class I SAM-dependent methyltransferase [Nanoarchaeota archaeon]